MDAGYLRAQARRCLEIAQQMSDRNAADILRVQAQHYHQRAVELEADRDLRNPSGLEEKKQ